MRVVVLLFAVVGGCSREPAPAAAPVPCEQPRQMPPPASPRLEVKPFCTVGEEIAFHVILENTYVYSDETAAALGRKGSTEREMWTLLCGRSGACSGTKLELEHADRGQPIDFMDVTSVVGATVISRSPSTAVIEWGPYRRITVDGAMHRVTYVETGAPSSTGQTGEGRGEAKCD